jgi:hypothetical protein
MSTNTRQALIEHYENLAMTKGWLEYTRYRVKELEICQSGLWSGIGQQIKERIDEKKKQLPSTVRA